MKAYEKSSPNVNGWMSDKVRNGIPILHELNVCLKRRKTMRNNKLNNLINIPMVDSNSENFIDDLNNAINQTMGSSANRNDRNRPYDGQIHTHNGDRGKTEVKGLTERDIADCIIQGFLASSSNPELQHKTFAFDKLEKEYHTEDWCSNDVYKIEADFDPIAVVQNTICFIEKYMGIFPNVPKIEATK